MAKQTRLKRVSITLALTLPKPAKGVEAEHEVKRYRVVGLYGDHESNKAPCSAYVLVTDSATRGTDAPTFVEADIDEGLETFQQGWIDLCVDQRERRTEAC